MRLRNAKDLVELPLSIEEQHGEASHAFQVRAPSHYLRLVNWDNPNDPIRRQIIPSPEELKVDPREREDPIGDLEKSPVPRLIHRYPDRVLLLPTYECAVYCRHCFRKESLGQTESFSEEALAPALSYLRDHKELREVILTGGDPLVLSNRQLAWLRERLEDLPHLRLLRLHTRVPVVSPTRVTGDLCSALLGTERLQVCVVTHFNHPQEITQAAISACRLLRKSGFMLLNQTVLLRGINDDLSTLRTLFTELVYSLGAKPYYLHHCDLTRGLTHLRTSIDRGLELMRSLRGHLSGLCQPLYVLDLPGGDGKIPLGPSYVEARTAHEWILRSYLGHRCTYEEVVPDNPAPL